MAAEIKRFKLSTICSYGQENPVDFNEPVKLFLLHHSFLQLSLSIFAPTMFIRHFSSTLILGTCIYIFLINY
jgi:hypothetical protein